MKTGGRPPSGAASHELANLPAVRVSARFPLPPVFSKKSSVEGAHRSRLVKPTVLSEGIVNESSSLPALRLFGYLAAPRLFGHRRELELRPATRAKGHDGHCVHSELAHGLAQSSNSNQRPVTRSYFASRLGMIAKQHKISQARRL